MSKDECGIHLHINMSSICVQCVGAGSQHGFQREKQMSFQRRKFRNSLQSTG